MEFLTTEVFRFMLENAENNLLNYQKEIDAKNVFPVPDGDTGTNMTMTFQNGVLESKKITSDSIYDIAKGLSFGLLMGARGNSGVITSQIFRGFYMGLEKDQEVSVKMLAKAFMKGSEVSYKAVMKPVEGTILTVIRESSYYAYDYVKSNKKCTVEEYFEELVRQAQISLDNTPELMPLLKEVGVVDSGGFGLLTIFKGFLAAVKGEKIERLNKDVQVEEAQTKVESDEFGYCTEFILRLSETGKLTYEEEKLKRNLSKLGNSLVVVTDEDLVKVHVHTLTPGNALNMAQRYGEFVKLKIENMSIQHENIIDMSQKEQPKKPYALISVAAGDGLVKAFRDLRVDHIVSGGQTMNPSCEDFVDAIHKIHADHIFIFPNNSNIILAANQARDICSDQDITVFATTSIQEGLTACLSFNPDADKETNIANMEEAIQHIVTGRITYAIKDTQVEGVSISENDYMGIQGKHIITSGKDLLNVAKQLIDSMVSDDAELFTLIAGEDAKEDDITAISKYIEDTYDLEVDTIQGDQPVFYYLFAVE